MKIKTVAHGFLGAEAFDREVNEALATGWQVVRREVIPGGPLDSNKLYAELVMPDPAPEPEAIDPFQAMRTIKDACLANAGPCGDCPMAYWCWKLKQGGDPSDWELPEVEG